MCRYPYQLWVKQDNAAWRCLASSHNLQAMRAYGVKRVVHGNNVERIELRDAFGASVLETLFDRSWK